MPSIPSCRHLVAALVPLTFMFALAAAAAAPASVGSPSRLAATAATPSVRLGILAGTPFALGSADGIGPAARFTFPRGIAISRDASFALIADSSNHTIRRITLASAQVTTIAGSPGQDGRADGTGTAARFSSPREIALSSDGSFALIADSANSIIRRLDLASRAVTTIAGSGAVGSADGIGTAASFSSPWGIAMTADDSMALITDSGNYTIRKLVLASGVVSTVAGVPLAAGSADGVGAAARLRFPYGIAISADGSVAVLADGGNYTVRRFDVATGSLTTLAGQAGQPGSADGVGGAARFNGPQGIALRADGRMAIVSDPINYTLRHIDVTTGTVVTLVGLEDGRMPAERPGGPVAVTLDPAGSVALITDTGKQLIWRADVVARQAVYVPLAAR